MNRSIELLNNVNFIKHKSKSTSLDYVFVTTASLPWRTGTSINPLHRVSNFTKKGYRVALVIPWTNPKDQELLYNEVLFDSPQEQKDWLLNRLEQMGLEAPKAIIFYKSRFYNYFKSIFPAENLSELIPPCKHLILEEPDHLFMLEKNIPNFKASKKIGILHTNYEFYYDRANSYFINGFMNNLTNIIIDSTDKSIALSAVVTNHPGREFVDVLPVNGVREKFFQSSPKFKSKALSSLFIGKLIWEKGFLNLIKISAETNLSIDIYGDGPNKLEIELAAKKAGANFNFMGSTNRVDRVLKKYDLFINPSESEVYCTTNCEALAAGLYLLIPDHVSNAGFGDYENALFYDNIHTAIKKIKSLRSDECYKERKDSEDKKDIKTLSLDYACQQLIDYCDAEANELAIDKKKINSFQTKLIKKAFRLLAIIVLFIQDMPNGFKQFIKFTIIGTPILIVNFTAVYLFESIMQSSRLVSILGVNELNTIAAFFLHHFITFKKEKEQQKTNTLYAFVQFHYSSIICMFIFTICTYLLATLNLSLYMATFISMCLTNIVSYLYTSKIIYKGIDQIATA